MWMISYSCGTIYPMSDTEFRSFPDNLIDRVIKQFRLYSMFGIGRLTRHQFMRNFAIAQFVGFGSASIFSIIIALGFGLVSQYHSVPLLQQKAIIAPYIIAEGWIFTLFILMAQAFAALQRFHDMNKSGWMALTLVVPLLNFYFLYKLVSSDSAPSSNEYGPQPTTDVKSRRKVEIFFVIALLLGVFGGML